MKKLLSIILVLTMLIAVSTSLAEGMGVQIIGGPAVDTEMVTLDDFKLNTSISIDGYGIITGTRFEIIDQLGYYEKGRTSPKYTNWDNDYYKSGAEAEYALLKIDFINLSTYPKDFLAQCEVKVVFDELYEYAGWYYQYNYNNETHASESRNTDDVINSDDNFPIDPMYAGHYCFGCTLPNAVINSKAPLKMIITIDGNEITYNIRK